ncbi:MAG: sugar O-acetyltransferase [Candidatus Lokiarchaeota archaeon]|nr:sugar O-acetyltransferase [Candidatus Lokiarchaeota archaeon]
MKTEKEKMLAGVYYNPSDPELSNDREKAKIILRRFNTTPVEEADKKIEIINKFFGSVGQNCWIEPPFQCDYGYNINLDEHVYFNVNCVVLDGNKVNIGKNVMFGPAVQIYTVTHPLDPNERLTGKEITSGINIGDNAWIGGSSVILPGIIIGENSIIGAGSIVTKPIPDNVIARGNPCRVIKKIEKKK